MTVTVQTYDCVYKERQLLGVSSLLPPCWLRRTKRSSGLEARTLAY